MTQGVVRDRPVAFISSFYREKEGYASYRDSPLWRQDLAALEFGVVRVDGKQWVELFDNR